MGIATLFYSQDGKGIELINPNATGIDIGADSHWVSVPLERDSQPVRRFGCFTSDLYALDKKITALKALLRR